MNRVGLPVLAGVIALALPSPLSPVAMAAEAVRPAANLLRVHIIDVGQGDCTVIEGPRSAKGDRRILVIDVGETAQQGNEAKHKVLPYLRKMLDDGSPNRAQVTIDYFLLSHYHKDHMGAPSGEEGSGIFWLSEQLDVKVGRVLDTGIDYDAGGMGDRTWRQWVKDQGVQREPLAFDQLGKDRQIDLGEGVWVEVLSVGAVVEGRGRVVKDRWISTTSQNDFSAAIVIHYGKFDMFTAGDQSGYLHESWGSWYHSIEAAMFPHLRPLEVYRVNHHGSQWSSCYPFLQRIEPEVALISNGKGHHHPNEYTVQRLLGWEEYRTGRPHGTDIFQTRQIDGFVLPTPHPHTGRAQRVADGPIVVETDGETDFKVVLPDQPPISYAFDDIPPYTDVPWTVKKARARAESKDDEEYNRFYDREDEGSLPIPEGDESDGPDD